ncbi:MAG: rhodanese-like domain-containing protein [Candidatus Bathyarchaeia archaeon]
MVKKTLMAIAVLLTLCIVLISQGAAAVKPIHFKSQTRTIPAIVSTEWLKQNLTLPKLVVLDVRSQSDYALGHIEGAINVPEENWYVHPSGLLMELPEWNDLSALIGGSGIKKDSLVVVVGSTIGNLPPTFPPTALYNMAGTTRVAVTLLYAGVRNVAVLDGGYEKWVKEGKPTTTDIPSIKPVTYDGKANEEMFVSIDYVKKRPGKIVDARDPDVYFGVTTELWTAYPGHIPTAKCLPTPWLWNIILKEDGTVDYITYKDVDTLEKMASGVIDKNKNREVIIYCGVGGYASTLYFVLSEVLGYKNVKMYDGSAQEWTGAGEPVVVYQWE